MTDLDLDDLANELRDFAEPDKKVGRSAREERIISGFEDIQQFVDEHGRLPLHGEGREIFERLLAVRLDRLRHLPESSQILAPLDRQGLLGEAAELQAELDDDALLAELEGVDAPSEIENLVHVPRPEDVVQPDEIATRKPCADFQRFKPLFQKVQQELIAKLRTARPFELKSEIESDRYFIVNGQIAYVAEKAEVFTNDQGRRDARLRVVFDNGTESNMLMRSLQRQLNADPAGRRISDPDVGPLFGDSSEEGDFGSGTIYVLRSYSKDPRIQNNRDVIHKIGVTGNDVESRIASAKVDPTFLLADVEIVASYVLFNVNRVKLENLVHRFFEPARLDLEMQDRFGRPFRPREWFLVPLEAIDEAVRRIKDGTITNCRYDVNSASIIG
ncbi:GIY-YIG nuclease family protein [Bradyrhizobium sp. NBAIM14]|uniref:GIY-YIG nuclease family protein n=1 Tax=Bradyrhizobium sp. NBAIM14 TaxID=2793814 RepID=UPI001CD44829|nr:GIY-YIG nuclease family protein [Bradyrhizobium sp. NBAIM14]MCA1498856.1 GIY-YIG nuclease family protein [Bradyrhizobium sp. NBAIM14]